MYEYAIDYFSVRGFKQYEVSNFAKGGFECKHNMRYWENNPYTGLGASAVSYKDGVRSKNTASVEGYIQASREGKGHVESTEKLSPLLSAKETAAVKIRTKAGIDFDWFEEKTGFDFLKLEGKTVQRLVDDGLVKYTREGSAVTGVCLRRKGFFFCDTVSSALLRSEERRVGKEGRSRWS